eukprot:TRINITY_DN1918_c0_g1_i1.p1 TRINITY_DN1918_c0_g1~~TRINITY_DN1918_c0_g1_i1.p1  ORF type:complete len:370 (-),score=68.57 TRINITY_DN1918_c0_g1_i1:15-1124(-)
MVWLSEHPYTKSCQHVAYSSSPSLQLSSTSSSSLLVPAPGNHFFFHRGRLLWLHYNKYYGEEGILRESVSVRFLGNNRTTLETLLEVAQEKYRESKRYHTGIYTAETRYGELWKESLRLPKRKPESVVLSDHLLDSLQKDVQDFLEGEEFYRERGIPYRRGYLLHGPAGSGKTSTVLTLAGTFGLDIYCINLSSHSLTDEGLVNLLQQTPRRSLILFEEIDKHAGAWLTGEDEEKSNVSLAALLNCLDGVLASSGRLIFMTANSLEPLPPTLLRPGRIDRHVYVGYASDKQIEELFVKFYAGRTNQVEVRKLATEFVKKVRTLNHIPITPASLQGYFLEHKTSPEDALRNVDNEWLKETSLEHFNEQNE